MSQTCVQWKPTCSHGLKKGYQPDHDVGRGWTLMDWAGLGDGLIQVNDQGLGRMIDVPSGAGSLVLVEPVRGINDGPCLDRSGLVSDRIIGVGPDHDIRTPIGRGIPINPLFPSSHQLIHIQHFSILSSSPANTSPRRQALIADERSSFYCSWNATTIAHARGSRLHPYPPPSSVFTRANTAENCDEDFSDLGVTARRKLERLQGSVFAHSLLERGTYHAMEGIEVYNSPIEVLMGYTSSVGVMLAEEIALTNDVVGAVSVTTRGTVARVSELEDTVRGLETIIRRLKRSHESLRIYTEMELANRDLTIGLLRARVNSVAPMEIDLTTTEDKEYISAPGTPPTSSNTSTTNISVRVETPELVILEGVLIPIEDSSDEDGEGEVVVPDENEAPEPVGIILPR
ncbi:hypothetical protein BDM02DRAFT_3132725 [Thelephora ganbajun]|uniref:Uncharacterized protein n=1 Tax=Thelephora ganbajun TaxID=370292 RepID=A0ACB6Z0G2_THEGA|nr:hypothetical protein BDM02DRAFT_3132725 [Thelephora ganbajun]